MPSAVCPPPSAVNGTSFYTLKCNTVSAARKLKLPTPRLPVSHQSEARKSSNTQVTYIRQYTPVYTDRGLALIPPPSGVDKLLSNGGKMRCVESWLLAFLGTGCSVDKEEAGPKKSSNDPPAHQAATKELAPEEASACEERQDAINAQMLELRVCAVDSDC